MEYCSVAGSDGAWRLTGRVVLLSRQPSWLEYDVSCDDVWRSRRAEVRGVVDGSTIDVNVEARSDGWFLNDELVASVSGAVDIDLNFSPSTNLLPIRRLNLEVGEERSVRAAWLRFPSFTLEPLEQTYRRVSGQEYEYRSASFRAALAVDDFGLPIEYAGVWRAVG